MKLFYFTIVFVLLASPFCYGKKMYSWVDESGTRHFSDSSPSETVHDEYMVKESSSKKPHYSTHYLYRIIEGKGYCGDRQFPGQKEEDPKKRLIHLLSAQKNTVNYKQNLIQESQLLRKKYKNKDLIKRLNTSIRYKVDECDCLLAWMEEEIKSLESVKDQILLEARQAELQYGEIENICGPTPASGTYTDPDTIAWAECKEKHRKQRNELLRKKKSSLALEEALSKDI